MSSTMTTVRWRTIWASALGLACAIAAATPADVRAQPQAMPDPMRDARVARLRASLRREPTVAQVQARALRYFEVHPEAVASLRSRTTSRAALPELRLGYHLDLTTDAEAYVGAGSLEGERADNDRSLRGHRAGAELVWNLPGAVFDPAELSSYALTGVQLSVLREVTRLFYTRRQILLGLAIDPPADPRARLALELRVEEQTAMLDAMTGGWFSRELLRRARR
ncbi:MAG: hypothetical protein IT379_40330 [Deltaproteobacteria bacterium]|nr:hypothetical protein [Deltaproteobacteria bacterium]